MPGTPGDDLERRQRELAALRIFAIDTFAPLPARAVGITSTTRCRLLLLDDLRSRRRVRRATAHIQRLLRDLIVEVLRPR
jgi:hypothetical protein